MNEDACSIPKQPCWFCNSPTICRRTFPKVPHLPGYAMTLPVCVWCQVTRPCGLPPTKTTSKAAA